MPRPPFLESVYATDEDAYNVNPADYGLLAPVSNLMAQGVDGVFGASARWTLMSESNDFTAQGVAPGMVVEVDPMRGTAVRRPQYLAVEAVGGSSLGLRRCGFAAGQGAPPGPPGGFVGVTFKIISMYPQLENAAYVLDQKYQVDPRMPNRTPGDMNDQRTFRRLVVLWSLVQLYSSDNRSKEGDWANKLREYQRMYDEELETAVVRWGPVGLSQPETTRFSTRVVR